MTKIGRKGKERKDLSSSSKGTCMDHVQNEGRGWFSPRRCRMLIQETFGIKYSKDTIWLNELCVRVASKGSIKLYLDENYAQNRGESLSLLEHDIQVALCEIYATGILDAKGSQPEKGNTQDEQRNVHQMVPVISQGEEDNRQKEQRQPGCRTLPNSTVQTRAVTRTTRQELAPYGTNFQTKGTATQHRNPQSFWHTVEM